MRVTAIVPIKEHSERIPNKNFRMLNGVPLYEYILRTLTKVKEIDTILVDTDIPSKIMFHNEKIKIIERPPELRGDFISVNKLIENDLKYTDNDIILQTHVTNPFIKARTIDISIQRYHSIKRPLFAVTLFNDRFWFDGKPVNHNPDELIRTQELKPVLLDNSCLYIFSKQFFINNGRRMNETSIPFIISKEEALDIDDEYDWRIAECLIKQ